MQDGQLEALPPRKQHPHTGDHRESYEQDLQRDEEHRCLEVSDGSAHVADQLGDPSRHVDRRRGERIVQPRVDRRLHRLESLGLVPGHPIPREIEIP